jgi:hypothetical protein
MRVDFADHYFQEIGNTKGMHASDILALKMREKKKMQFKMLRS